MADFTSDDDGNVLIHGFDLNNGELIYSYEPPILMVPSVLSVGDQWCTTTDRGNARDWYGSGVGRVAEQIYQYFELASYTQPPTPIRETSWGHIKREFETITKSN